MTPARTPALLALAAALCAACVDNDATQDTPLDAPVASDHARFTARLTVPGGAFVRGANSFTVQLANTDGSPAVLTHVSADMPAHGHGTDTPAIDDHGGGSFDVHDLPLTMPGEWEIRLTASRTGATDDDVITLWAEVE